MCVEIGVWDPGSERVCVFAHAEELKEPVICALPSSRGFTGLINTEHTKRS